MIKGILTLLLAVAVVGSCWAAPKKNHGDGSHKIIQVDLSSITLALKEGSDEHETYQISKNTKITINGSSANISDLRAGMMAKVAAGSDKVATGIEATDPPRHPARHRVG